MLLFRLISAIIPAVVVLVISIINFCNVIPDIGLGLVNHALKILLHAFLQLCVKIVIKVSIYLKQQGCVNNIKSESQCTPYQQFHNTKLNMSKLMGNVGHVLITVNLLQSDMLIMAIKLLYFIKSCEKC